MRRHHWDYRRGYYGPQQFVWRMGCSFALMIFLAWIAASALVAFFQSPRQVLVVAFAVVVACVLVCGFIIAMRRASHVYRQQDRLRRQLMADVAHELRTPLSILQGRIEGLLDGVYPRDDERLGQLLDETKHLSRLVEDLRTIANAEAGALELRKEAVDMAELIRDAATSFERPIAIDVPPNLPPIDVDPVRMREVLLNLLSNAVRHTPADRAVSIRAERQPRRLILRVMDEGRGIAPEDLPHVFDRFQKGRDSRGSGLGLSIAKDLVMAHGGTIAVASDVGRGTTVTISLPA